MDTEIGSRPGMAQLPDTRCGNLEVVCEVDDKGCTPCLPGMIAERPVGTRTKSMHT